MRVTLFSLLMLGVVLLSMAVPVHAGVLLGGWTMDDNAANNTVADVSGNGNDGSLVTGGMGATTDENTNKRSIAGKFGTALDLHSGAYADLTSHFAALKPADNNYSLTMWVKNSVAGGIDANPGVTHTLFAWDTDHATDWYPRLQLDIGRIATPKKVGYFHASTYTGAGYVGTGVLPTLVADEWYHVALTVEEDPDTALVTSRIYLDGTELATMTAMARMWGSGPSSLPVQTVGMHSSLNQVHIGGTDYGGLSDGGQYANLPLDDVGLWAGTLSPTEIQDVIVSGISPVPEPGTIALLISASVLVLPLFWRRRRS